MSFSSRIGCAAVADELHQRELEILNMIYCHVMRSNDVITKLKNN
jgi:hypothetical protein